MAAILRKLSMHLWLYLEQTQLLMTKFSRVRAGSSKVDASLTWYLALNRCVAKLERACVLMEWLAFPICYLEMHERISNSELGSLIDGIH